MDNEVELNTLEGLLRRYGFFEPLIAESAPLVMHIFDTYLRQKNELSELKSKLTNADLTNTFQKDIIEPLQADNRKLLAENSELQIKITELEGILKISSINNGNLYMKGSHTAMASTYSEAIANHDKQQKQAPLNLKTDIFVDQPDLKAATEVLNERLKDMELKLNIAERERDQFKEAHSEIKSEYINAVKKISENDELIEKQNEIIKQLKNEIVDSHNKIEKLSQLVFVMENKVTEIEKRVEKDIEKQQIKDKKEQKVRVEENDVQENKEKVKKDATNPAAGENEAKILKMALEDAKSTIELLQQKNNLLNAKLEKGTQMSSILQSLQSDLEASNTHRDILSAKLAEVKKEAETLKQKNTELVYTAETASLLTTRLDQKIKSLEVEKLNEIAKVDALSSQINELTNKLNINETKRIKMENEMLKLTTKINDIKIRRKADENVIIKLDEANFELGKYIAKLTVENKRLARSLEQSKKMSTSNPLNNNCNNNSTKIINNNQDLLVSEGEKLSLYD